MVYQKMGLQTQMKSKEGLGKSSTYWWVDWEMGRQCQRNCSYQKSDPCSGNSYWLHNRSELSLCWVGNKAHFEGLDDNLLHFHKHNLLFSGKQHHSPRLYISNMLHLSSNHQTSNQNPRSAQEKLEKPGSKKSEGKKSCPSGFYLHFCFKLGERLNLSLKQETPPAQNLMDLL